MLIRSTDAVTSSSGLVKWSSSVQCCRSTRVGGFKTLWEIANGWCFRDAIGWVLFQSFILLALQSSPCVAKECFWHALLQKPSWCFRHVCWISFFTRMKQGYSWAQEEQEQERVLLTYLHGNGSSQSIQVFKELADADGIPRIAVVFSENQIRREAIAHTSSALRRRSTQQPGLRRSIQRRILHALHEAGPRMPQSLCDWRPISPWPQTERLLDRCRRNHDLLL